MTYPREGAWVDDPAHAQQLCEILHRSHPEVLRELEKAAMKDIGSRPKDILSSQTTFAYDNGREDGYEDGVRAGKSILRGKIKDVIYPEEEP